LTGRSARGVAAGGAMLQARPLRSGHLISGRVGSVAWRLVESRCNGYPTRVCSSVWQRLMGMNTSTELRRVGIVVRRTTSSSVRVRSYRLGTANQPQRRIRRSPSGSSMAFEERPPNLFSRWHLIVAGMDLARCRRTLERNSAARQMLTWAHPNAAALTDRT
jgi:hypothetical protein